ncbi:MAG TPA: dolichyl-phosphate beta-glucosyltransferase [Chloroflexota bacterium]|nr:dolichyl-phosphate beta-glucosyltransferase [Chloroflexota bacterium]
MARACPDLSIVIPAYNEAQRLPPSLWRLAAYLADAPYRFEIVVVSNGSDDGTEDVVRGLVPAIPGLRLVVETRRGKGLAVRRGIEASRGQIVLLCDADLSMPPEHISDFLASLAHVDVVVGSREAPGARRIGEPWHRHVMGRVFNALVRGLAVPGIDDTQCGFKAFRRDAAETLARRQTINGFGFDVELLYLARKYGYRMKELPITWHFDPASRVRPGIDTFHMLRELITIRLRDLRGAYGPVHRTPEPVLVAQTVPVVEPSIR